MKINLVKTYNILQIKNYFAKIVQFGPGFRSKSFSYRNCSFIKINHNLNYATYQVHSVIKVATIEVYYHTKVVQIDSLTEEMTCKVCHLVVNSLKPKLSSTKCSVLFKS